MELRVAGGEVIFNHFKPSLQSFYILKSIHEH